MTENDTPRWVAIEAVYGRAIELPPGERGAYLDEACANDAALRAEVESLLASGEPATELFDRLADVILSFPAETFEARFREGTKVGAYEIIAELGRGGMSVVYSARDPRLDRLVALKFLPPYLSDKLEASARFRAEAKAASATDHPNIGTVYEIAETPDGTPYLAIAFYEGETLKERLERGPLPPPEAAAIAGQIAAGLTAAHRRGIVHRDIKPANLLLTKDGLVKILDFGVAQIVGSEVQAAGGTIGYMSPEQIRGGPVDQRTDLWSLGVVLHEMLTGSRPFRGSDEAEVMRAILHDAPSHAGGTNGSMPGRLARIVLRLLEKDPARRYARAEELLPELDYWQAARGVRRRIRAAWLAGAVGIAMAGLLVWRGERFAEPVVAADRVAVLPFSVLGSPGYDYLGAGMVDLLSTSLDGAEAMQSVDPRAVLALTGDEQTRIDPARGAMLSARLGAGRYVLGDIVAADGMLRIQASLYDRERGDAPVAHAAVEGRTERIFNLVDELTTQLLLAEYGEPEGGLARVAVLTTSSLPALKAYLQGERAMRGGRFSDAVEAYENAVSEDSLFALAHYRLSKAASWDRRYGLAREAAEQAVRHADRLSPASRHLVEANLANWRGDRVEAERLLRLALAVSPDNVEAWHELGELLFHYNGLRGRSRFEAQEPFERALALDPRHGESLIHLFELAAWEGDRPAVEALFQRLEQEGDPGLGPRAVRALALREAASWRSVLEEAAQAGDRTVYRAFEDAASLAPERPETVALARLLTDPRHTPDWRAIGHCAVGILELGQGRWGTTAAELDAAGALEPDWELQFRALYVILPFLPATRAQIAGTRDAVLRWDATVPPPNANRLIGVHDAIRPQVRLYLLGLLESRLGEREAALGRAEALERVGGDSLGASLGRALAGTVRAHLAWGGGRPSEALAMLNAREPIVLADQTHSPILAQYFERWMRAEILLALGRDDEAAEWYGSVGDHNVYGIPYKAQTHLRRGQIADRAGDRESAAAHYAQFIALWKDADPPLAPLVERARRRLATLRAGA